MKYQVISNNNAVLETVEDVSYFKHVEGYFYFFGPYEEDRETHAVLFTVSDSVVRIIKKID